MSKKITSVKSDKKFWVLLMRNLKNDVTVPWNLTVSKEDLAKSVNEVRTFMAKNIQDSFHLFPEEWILHVICYDGLTYQPVPDLRHIYPLSDWVRKESK